MLFAKAVGLGSVPGIFAGAITFGLFVPELLRPVEGLEFFAAMLAGGAIGARLGANLPVILRIRIPDKRSHLIATPQGPPRPPDYPYR